MTRKDMEIVERGITVYLAQVFARNKQQTLSIGSLQIPLTITM